MSQDIYRGDATGTKYPFVLGMLASVGGQQGLCTATLIAPNLAVTARHCVSDTNTQYIQCGRTRFTTDTSASRLAVTTKPEMTQRQSDYYGVREIVLPDTTAMCGADVALLILSENIPASEATPIVPLIHNSLQTDEAVLTRITAIGFGTTNGAGAGGGERRYRQNIPVMCAFNHPQSNRDCRGAGDTSDMLADADIVVGEGTCEGDSGSSAFEQTAFDQGRYFSVGVLSRGAADSCDQGVYTRLDAHKDMIIDAARRAAQLGGYSEPEWITNPNPDTPPAGSSSSGGSSNAPPKAGFEESCEYSDDCESGICIEYGGSTRCTTACEDNACPDGYSCSGDGSYCEPQSEQTSSNADGTTVVKSGCAMAADPTRPIPWRAAAPLAFAFGALLMLRRRSQRLP